MVIQVDSLDTEPQHGVGNRRAQKPFFVATVRPSNISPSITRVLLAEPGWDGSVLDVEEQEAVEPLVLRQAEHVNRRGVHHGPAAASAVRSRHARQPRTGRAPEHRAHASQRPVL